MPSLALTGLGNAGKTSLADVSFVGRSVDEVIKGMVPTVGVSTLKFRYLDFSVNMVDLGGQKSFREYYLLNPYVYRGVDLLIHVLDVQNKARFAESRDFFDRLRKALKKEHINPQICIFLHKYDPDKKNELKDNVLEATHLFQGFPIYLTSILDGSCNNTFRNVLLEFRPEFAKKIMNILVQFKGILVEVYIVDQEGWVIEYSGEQGMPVKGSKMVKSQIKGLTSLYKDLFEGMDAFYHLSVESESRVMRIYPLSAQFFLFVSYHKNQEWNQNLGQMIQSLVQDMRVAVSLLEI